MLRIRSSGVAAQSQAAKANESIRAKREQTHHFWVQTFIRAFGRGETRNYECKYKRKTETKGRVVEDHER
jgi:hypothetical protein